MFYLQQSTYVETEKVSKLNLFSKFLCNVSLRGVPTFLAYEPHRHIFNKRAKRN